MNKERIAESVCDNSNVKQGYLNFESIRIIVL